jgi:hypothetical protein
MLTSLQNLLPYPHTSELSIVDDEDATDMISGDVWISNEHKFRELYQNEQYAGKIQLVYEYDHAECWEHNITFLDKADPVFRASLQLPEG